MLPAERRGRDSKRRNPSLFDLLVALGFTERERISINTQFPGGRFISELFTVGELTGWSPPAYRNVWFGVNPVGQHVRHGRGAEGDIARVRVLFADLDVKPGRQFATLDQCYATARRLADGLGAEPIGLIESGHGLQPLWRIGSPPGDSNVIDRDRVRDEWKTIYQRWGGVVQAAAEAVWSPDGAHNTCSIDNVFDLTRLLRCPGSINWKNPDDPVPVRTRLLGHRRRVLMREFVSRLDRDGVQQLKTVRESVVGVPTDFDEASTWIDELPGATADLDELRELPASRVLAAYLDPAALGRVIAEGDGGAHATMRDKVLHAVYAAQEGRAGLVVALNNLGQAYLNVMDARAAGELSGDVRDAATATRKWASAVRGAVAKARGRVVPNVETWGSHAYGDAGRRWPKRPRRPNTGRRA
jgi:hypothetical protein